MSEASLWFRSAAALATIAAVLFGLQHVLRRLQQGGVALVSRRRTMLRHVETLPLPGGVAVHVVRIAGRLYALGGGQGHLHLIAEIAAVRDSGAKHDVA